MSAHVDTTTKLSYLLPTGTFLTFQVPAPLATNNSHCGRTEQILTAVILALLVASCIATSFTDSCIDSNGTVYNGFLTYKRPGSSKKNKGSTGSSNPNEGDTGSSGQASSGPASGASPEDTKQNGVSPDEYFKLLPTDYINAALSTIAFLTLTIFTDPVSSCFYPHLSAIVLKTLPVLLATVVSFCCPLVQKIRNGYGISVPHTIPTQVPESSLAQVPVSITTQVRESSRAICIRTHDVRAGTNYNKEI